MIESGGKFIGKIKEAHKTLRRDRLLPAREQIKPLTNTTNSFLGAMPESAVSTQLPIEETGDYRVSKSEQYAATLIEYLDYYLPNQVSNEIQAINAIVENASEQLAYTKKPRRKPVSKSNDTNETRVIENPRVIDTSVKMFTASSLTIADKMAEIDQFGKFNNVQLLFAVDAPHRNEREEVIGKIFTALVAHVKNRDKSIIQDATTDTMPQDQNTEYTIATFPPTPEEQEALMVKPGSIPQGYVKGEYYEYVRLKGRSKNTIHSAFVLKLPTHPQIHIYLGLMPIDDVETTLSEHGRNFRCIGEYHPKSYTVGKRHYVKTNPK